MISLYSLIWTVLDQLPVASPDSRFKKKNSLPDEVWGYFYLYFICILCNQNVNTNRSTSVSEGNL